MTAEEHRELLGIIMRRKPGIPRHEEWRGNAQAPPRPAAPAADTEVDGHWTYASARDEFDSAMAALVLAKARFNQAERRVRRIVDRAAEPFRKLMEARR